MARATSKQSPKLVLKEALLAEDRPTRSKSLVRTRSAAAKKEEVRREPAPVRARASKKPLEDYKAKRDFARTPEPVAKKGEAVGNRFCVQKHDARRLHYDLRLELNGVLKSWAVTKGPSLLPGDKRLAVHTEDHPLEYLTFEGVIPAGEYGGGTMIVWDQGRWEAEGDPRDAYRKGRLTFTLHGERLRGRWHLVRTRSKPGQKKEQWLLLKSDDEHARGPREPEIVQELNTSIISGKTNDDLAAGATVQAKTAPTAVAPALAARRSAPKATKVAGAKKAPLPTFVEPALAKLCEKAPSGAKWVHEIKFDGYRLQARIERGKVQLLTRKGLDWTHKFRPIAEALAALDLPSAIIDGELVVEDEAGVSSFSGLQQALTAGATDRMVFYAFDLLYLDGLDLRDATLSDRKSLLQLALDDMPPGFPLRFSEHIAGDGAALVRHACRMGLEGIIAKRTDQPYRSGRGEAWLKIKCALRQEFVVAGYVPSTTSRKAVGSLVLGVYDGGKLVHVGRVGTGYTVKTAHALWAQLDTIETADPPFAARLPRDVAKGARWVKPDLVAEVEFRGWTHDGSVRQASFKGLREDKDPREVVREDASSKQQADPVPETASVRLTHPDRVLWEDEGVTKQGLADFYTEIADWILPHLVNRPLALVRCPSGSQAECFFQKHAWAGLDTSVVQSVPVEGDTVLAIKDLRGLLSLVQASVLEIHPWGSLVHDVEKPDRITFDLDPDEGLDWNAVVAATFDVRERLKQLKLESFVKTTGGKGLHVVVPLKPKASWDEVKTFCESIAVSMASDSPDKYTAVMSKRARTGRIFVDYLRNGRGATAVAAYSTRSRAGAPVSTPIEWSELPNLRSGAQFRVATVPGRLRHLTRDPWQELWSSKQTLPVPPRARKRR